MAAQDPTMKYSLGSVLNHVLLHQTIIGEEAMLQMSGGREPDVVIGCAGGGSELRRPRFPYLRQDRRRSKARVIAVEPAACPTLTRGRYAYDFGDTAHLTPLVKMHTLGSSSCRRGSTQAACAITAWRRWSATSKTWADRSARLPTSRLLRRRHTIRAQRGHRARARIDSCRALRIDEALRCKQKGKAETILFNLSGHGHFDMGAYIAYFEGKLTDQSYDESCLAMALSGLPGVAA